MELERKSKNVQGIRWKVVCGTGVCVRGCVHAHLCACVSVLNAFTIIIRDQMKKGGNRGGGGNRELRKGAEE